MTFWGGIIDVGGLDTEGSGMGVEMWLRTESLCPLRDFLIDFIAKNPVASLEDKVEKQRNRRRS